MRKAIQSILCITLFVPLFSDAGNFKVNFNYLAFALPNETSYMELQFLFHGDGLTYLPTNQQTYQAIIGAELFFERNDTLIKRSYTFTGEEYQDSLQDGKNDIYNVVRIPLPEGAYRMKMLVYDKNNPASDTLSFTDDVKLDFLSEVIAFSDIMPVGFFTKATQENNFTKYGIDYMPYFSDFYPDNISLLTFMTEIYHTDTKITGDDFVIHSYISRKDEDAPFSSRYEKWEKVKTADRHIVFQSFKIDSLPSGNYRLQLEARNSDDTTLLARTSLFFQRSNQRMQYAYARMDSLSYDTLKLYLDYIYIIANEEERKFINNISPEKYKEIEDFFDFFWSRRNPENPKAAWHNYYNQVMKTNYNYSTLKNKGYRTDRGYYYLKYGKPSDVEYEHSNVNGPPYEIWTYHVTPDGQVNVFFVFYNADLTTNDFRLLHSTARGEVRNNDWKKILYIEDGIDKGEIEMIKDE
ncbi:MAG: GWxTD domain-containing protein [Bacteroidales bacterium]|jgi:GWxTD domain-containing protein|nr:GWxTD domain-containing protein [Bacteroidales bacterium]